MQVVFADGSYNYTTTNTTVASTWPVSGPRHLEVSTPILNASHPLEILTAATNIITLRSKLNWIGESSTLLGIISGETSNTGMTPDTTQHAVGPNFRCAWSP